MMIMLILTASGFEEFIFNFNMCMCVCACVLRMCVCNMSCIDAENQSVLDRLIVWYMT